MPIGARRIEEQADHGKPAKLMEHDPVRGDYYYVHGEDLCCLIFPLKKSPYKFRYNVKLKVFVFPANSKFIIYGSPGWHSG